MHEDYPTKKLQEECFVIATIMSTDSYILVENREHKINPLPETSQIEYVSYELQHSSQICLYFGREWYS